MGYGGLVSTKFLYIYTYSRLAGNREIYQDRKLCIMKGYGELKGLGNIYIYKDMVEL